MSSKYSEETKAAVLTALLEGQAVTHVADKYDIPRSTVSTWKRRDLGRISETVATQKKEELGDLILKYLRETLKTLTTQAEFARTKEWLAKQPASELAVLHGVQTDKAIRLLEALSATDEDTLTDN